MAYYGLEHSYTKFSGKKLKSELSSFLPNLPGIIDAPGSQDNSSLRSVIEKPPIGGKELLPLTSVQLAGFRLHPGPVSFTISIKLFIKPKRLLHFICYFLQYFNRKTFLCIFQSFLV